MKLHYETVSPLLIEIRKKISSTSFHTDYLNARFFFVLLPR